MEYKFVKVSNDLERKQIRTERNLEIITWCCRWRTFFQSVFTGIIQISTRAVIDGMHIQWAVTEPGQLCPTQILPRGFNIYQIDNSSTGIYRLPCPRRSKPIHYCRADLTSHHTQPQIIPHIALNNANKKNKTKQNQCP